MKFATAFSGKKKIIFILFLVTGGLIAGRRWMLSFQKNTELFFVYGKIERTNGDRKYSFDRETLKKLGETTYIVRNPVDDIPDDTDSVSYTGVPLVKILSHTGLSKNSTLVYVRGRDGYTAAISILDIPLLQPLVAYRRNGIEMDNYPKGPAMLVFPLNDLSGDRRKEAQKKWVWSLERIMID